MTGTSSPKAFVVSLDQPSSGCTGNQVFSFDPMTYTTSARWAKRIPTYCSYLGIIFGSSVNIVYAYSFHSSTLKVSRIDDTSGYLLSWTYGFAGNSNPLYASISHKSAINSNNDDMLVVSG